MATMSHISVVRFMTVVIDGNRVTSEASFETSVETSFNPPHTKNPETNPMTLMMAPILYYNIESDIVCHIPAGRFVVGDRLNMSHPAYSRSY